MFCLPFILIGCMGVGEFLHKPLKGLIVMIPESRKKWEGPRREIVLEDKLKESQVV